MTPRSGPGFVVALGCVVVVLWAVLIVALAAPHLRLEWVP